MTIISLTVVSDVPPRERPSPVPDEMDCRNRERKKGSRPLRGSDPRVFDAYGEDSRATGVPASRPCQEREGTPIESGTAPRADRHSCCRRIVVRPVRYPRRKRLFEIRQLRGLPSGGEIRPDWYNIISSCQWRKIDLRDGDNYVGILP